MLMGQSFRLKAEGSIDHRPLSPSLVDISAGPPGAKEEHLCMLSPHLYRPPKVLAPMGELATNMMTRSPESETPTLFTAV